MFSLWCTKVESVFFKKKKISCFFQCVALRGDSVCLGYLSLQRPVVGDPICEDHVRGDGFSLIFCGHHFSTVVFRFRFRAPIPPTRTSIPRKRLRSRCFFSVWLSGCIMFQVNWKGLFLFCKSFPLSFPWWPTVLPHHVRLKMKTHGRACWVVSSRSGFWYLFVFVCAKHNIWVHILTSCGQQDAGMCYRCFGGAGAHQSVSWPIIYCWYWNGAAIQGPQRRSGCAWPIPMHDLGCESGYHLSHDSQLHRTGKRRETNTCCKHGWTPTVPLSFNERLRRPDLRSWRVEFSSRFVFYQLFVFMSLSSTKCRNVFLSKCYVDKHVVSFCGRVDSQPSTSRIILNVDDHKAWTIVSVVLQVGRCMCRECSEHSV